jgi:hypothetical protein
VFAKENSDSDNKKKNSIDVIFIFKIYFLQNLEMQDVENFQEL